MPSPSAENPGLFMRDPYKFSDAMLIVPPMLVECLRCFDGTQTELDLRAVLVRLTGSLEVEQIARHLMETLSTAGFLEDEAFEHMRDVRRQAFAECPVREPVHAGSAYPGDAAELRETIQEYMTADAPATPEAVGGNLFAIAAPHLSPE